MPRKPVKPPTVWDEVGIVSAAVLIAALILGVVVRVWLSGAGVW